MQDSERRPPCGAQVDTYNNSAAKMIAFYRKLYTIDLRYRALVCPVAQGKT